MFTPRNMRARESSPKRISLAAMILIPQILFLIVIPAKAGSHCLVDESEQLDSRLRGNDGRVVDRD
jgi:hypothetical protein